jgi:hypothetical protein
MEVAVRARHLSRHHPPYVRPPPGRSLDQVTAKAALETRARPQRCTGTVRLPPNLDERRPRRLEYVALAYGASQARAERREGATFEPARGPPSAPPRRSRPSRVASRRSGSRAVARPQRIPARRRPARPVRRGRDLGCDRGDCRRVRRADDRRTRGPRSLRSGGLCIDCRQPAATPTGQWWEEQPSVRQLARPQGGAELVRRLALLVLVIPR